MTAGKSKEDVALEKSVAFFPLPTLRLVSVASESTAVVAVSVVAMLDVAFRFGVIRVELTFNAPMVEE